MSDQGYIGWTCDGFEEVDLDDDDTIKDALGGKRHEWEEVPCSEVGCNGGWILLLVSKVKCQTCSGTGKIKKKKK